MKTKTFTIHGEQNAKGLTAWLVSKSQWFMFEPLPDNLYEVTVKEEIAETFADVLLLADLDVGLIAGRKPKAN